MRKKLLLNQGPASAECLDVYRQADKLDVRVQISHSGMSVCDHDPRDPEPLDLFGPSGESADMVMNQSHSWPDSAEDYSNT